MNRFAPIWRVIAGALVALSMLTAAPLATAQSSVAVRTAIDASPCRGKSLEFYPAANAAQGLYCLNGGRYSRPADLPGWSFTRAATNLLLRSQEFDNAAWVKSATASVTPNAAISPDGTLTADLISDPGGSFVNVSQGVTVTSGLNYTVYFILAPGSSSIAAVQAFGSGIVADTTVYFQLSGQGSYIRRTSTGTPVSASITPMANGFYQCTMTVLAVGSGSMGAVLYPALRADMTGGSPDAALTGTIYVAGAQLEPGTVANAYQPTTSAALSNAPITYAETVGGQFLSFSANTPRITDKGLLIEETRTNKQTSYSANPSEAAGFVGNPVNMTKSGDAAGVLSVVNDAAALAAAGLSEIATSGKVYKLDNSAGSVDARANFSGQTGNTNAHTVSAYIRGGTGSLDLSSLGPFAASSTYIRRTHNATPSSGSNIYTLRASAGQVVYFILPQLEEASSASSVIVTQGAAVTRAADVAYITGLGSMLAAPFSAAYLAEMNAYSGVVQRPMTLSDGSASSRYTLYRDTLGASGSGGNYSSGGLTNISVSGKTGSRVLKAALRAGAATRTLAVDGVIVGTQADAGTPVGVNRLDLGQLYDGTGQLNGYLQRVQVRGDVGDGQLTTLPQ